MPSPSNFIAVTSNRGRPNAVIDDPGRIQSLAQAILRHKAAKEARAGDNAMRQFTNSWAPVGKLATDLENLLGKPDHRSQNSVAYWFDTGDHGWTWVFQFSGQTITNVYRDFLD